MVLQGVFCMVWKKAMPLGYRLHLIMQFWFASQMWATRPHLGSIFEKLLHRKTFICLRLVTENNSLRKTSPIRFGKAGAHPQLAWESQLPLKPFPSLLPSDFKSNCDSSDLLLDFCSFSSYTFICSANVGCSPTPRQHFWKTAAPKNFYLPAACNWKQFS